MSRILLTPPSLLPDFLRLPLPSLLPLILPMVVPRTGSTPSLRFAFCENWQTALPLISLQYHDVELRITWGTAADADKWDVYANYAYLDTQEREVFASQPQNMLITQTQKAISSGSKIQELNFNHPRQVFGFW